MSTSIQSHYAANVVAGGLRQLAQDLRFYANKYAEVEIPEETWKLIEAQAEKVKALKPGMSRYRFEDVMKHRKAALMRYMLAPYEDGHKEARRTVLEDIAGGNVADKVAALEWNKEAFRACSRLFKPFLPGITVKEMDALRSEFIERTREKRCGKMRTRDRSAEHPSKRLLLLGSYSDKVKGLLARWTDGGRKSPADRVVPEGHTCRLLYVGSLMVASPSGKRSYHNYDVRLLKNNDTGRVRLLY
jgi:hypothetical protein